MVPCVILAAVLLLIPGSRPVIDRLRSVPEPSRRAAGGSERASDDPLAVAAVFDLLAACLRAQEPRRGATESESTS